MKSDYRITKWISQCFRSFYFYHQYQDGRDDQIAFYCCIRISTSCIQFVYRLSFSTDTRFFAVSLSNFNCRQLFVKMNSQSTSFQIDTNHCVPISWMLVITANRSLSLMDIRIRNQCKDVLRKEEMISLLSKWFHW